MPLTLTPDQQQAVRAAIRAGQVASIKEFIERALAELPKRDGAAPGWGAGTRIGWVAGSDLFLESTTSYVVAQELAGSDRLVGEQTLRHRLRERGLLASVDAGRQMVQVRRILDRRLRDVLHLKDSTLELRAQPSRTLSCRSA
jgi:hypothetical protein